MLLVVLFTILLNLTFSNITVAYNGNIEKSEANDYKKEKVLEGDNVNNGKTSDPNKLVINLNLVAGGANKTESGSNNTKTNTLQNVEQKPNKTYVENKDKIVNSTKNVTTTGTPIPVRIIPKNDLLHSGALLRGFYVFLGLSVLTVFYFVFRSYRLRHGSQPSTTVRKYGVTARRSDMEMRHLELDDDEDDTLFELSQNVNR